jgi:Family of unknown function (DUF6188)
MTSIDLSGQTLTGLRAEYTVGLTFTGDYFVLIQSPFTLTIHGEAISLTPDTSPPEALEPLQSLTGRTVTESTISDTGTLSLTFDDGSRVVVEPDGDYEAWNLAGPDGLIIVCMPSGELGSGRRRRGLARSDCWTCCASSLEPPQHGGEAPPLRTRLLTKPRSSASGGLGRDVTK